MSIPKIIHQIAPKDKLRWHPLWHRCQASWLKHFSNFEYKLWNDEEDIDNLVKTYFSDYWELYQDFPAHIMRIDFARFCMLHKYGGIYADMDVFCYQNFYRDLDKEFYIMEAPYGDVFLENALIASKLNHKILLECMLLSKKRFYSMVKKHPINVPFNNSKKDQLIITTACGPHLVASVFRNYLNDNNVSTFSGLTFNNHGLSYDKSFMTKHLLTGLWGKESIDYLHKYSSSNLQDTYETSWINEVNKFCNMENVTTETFDFYKDYTNNGFLKNINLDIDKNNINSDIELKTHINYN